MSLSEVVGVSLMYMVGVAPWLRWIYLSSRPTWRTPLRVAKVYGGSMTSDSDVAGLY